MPVRPPSVLAVAVAWSVACGALAAGASAAPAPDAASFVLPPGLVCEEVSEAVADAFDVTTSIGVVPFADLAATSTGFACSALAAGTGETFGSFLAAAEILADALRASGWVEDDRYLADGPTGTASGWRRGDDLAIVSVAWEPLPEAACPPDQPIFGCAVAPEHQAFTVSVTVARADVAAAGDAETVPATASARQVLAQVLQAERNEIDLVHLERVTWPDACLGVLQPDVMCAQVVTPGHRVAFEVAGARYVLHTDLLGGTVLLAEAPALDVSGAVASWHGAGPDGACLEAHALVDAVAVGRCHGPLLPGRFVRVEHRETLDALAARFGAAEVETVDGILRFAGDGSERLDGPRARAAAELLRAMAFEATSGRTGASWTVALTYHDPAGASCAGPSAQLDGRVLTVAATGLASVWACRDGEVVPVAADVPLDDARLATLYDALDRVGPITRVTTDGHAAAPVFTFAGRGGGTGDGADGADVGALEAWARVLLDELGGAPARPE